MQAKYFLEMMDGEFDEAYLEKRLVIAYIDAMILREKKLKDTFNDNLRDYAGRLNESTSGILAASSELSASAAEQGGDQAGHVDPPRDPGRDELGGHGHRGGPRGRSAGWPMRWTC